MKAEDLVETFKNIGNTSIEAIKKFSYNCNEKSWKIIKDWSKIGSAETSKNPKATLSTFRDVINS